MTDSDLELYGSMDPQVLQQILGLGTLGQDYEQAHEFAQPVGHNWGTVAGNIGGGLGDVLRQFGGGMRMRDIGQQQTGGRALYAQALQDYARRKGLGQQNPTAAGTPDMLQAPDPNALAFDPTFGVPGAAPQRPGALANRGPGPLLGIPGLGG